MKIEKYLLKLCFRLNNNFVRMKNTKVGDHCNFAHHCEVENTIIGDRTSIGRYSIIQNSDIGKYCSISWNVTIGAPSHDVKRLSTNAFTYRKLFGLVKEDKNFFQKKTVIGNDVWIGCHSIVIAGIKIGNGAVIGAGSVVTKDVEPYTIVAGVPAKIIKRRFDDSLIEKTEILNWWDFDDCTLKENLPLFEKQLDHQIMHKLLEIKEKLK